MKNTFLNSDIVAGFSKALVFDLDRPLKFEEIQQFESEYNCGLVCIRTTQYVVLTDDGTEAELANILKDLGYQE